MGMGLWGHTEHPVRKPSSFKMLEEARWSLRRLVACSDNHATNTNCCEEVLMSSVSCSSECKRETGET